ncbi:MAG: hypothetical protein QM817_01300 [Archangium sp.]
MRTRTFFFGLLLLTACVRATPRGDVYAGPCRVDADCPAGQRCEESRAHLRTASGEIVGDEVTTWCAAPTTDAGVE